MADLKLSTMGADMYVFDSNLKVSDRNAFSSEVELS